MKNYLSIYLTLFIALFGCSKEESLPDKPTVIPITGIVLSETSKTLKVDETFTIEAEVNPNNTTELKDIIWETSNASVATVNNGVVKAIKLGDAVITAKVGSKTATCKIIVTATEVTGITLSETEKEIYIGDVIKLVATIEPSNATNKEVIWSSSDNSIVNVSTDDIVTGISIGEATITAKSKANQSIFASCKIKVLPIPVTGISFNETQISLIEGRTYQAKYTISPNNATNKNVRFISHNTNLFEISEIGLITALSEGVSQITVISDDGNHEATVDVIVESFIKEMIIGMMFGTYSNPGGYISMNGSISLSNYSIKDVYVNQFMILDENNYIKVFTGIGSVLNIGQLVSIPVSFSNIYKAKAVFVITVNGNQHLIEKML